MVGREPSTAAYRPAAEAEAARQLVSFVDELNGTQLPDTRDVRDVTVDEAMERFLSEYLAGEKGRADKTVTDYRNIHRKWFSPTIGAKPVKRVDGSVMDELFGEMRQAGLSASRLNQAKSLYAPFFRWAKRRGMTLRNPMTDFEMPTSTYQSTERTPPEVEELSLLLSTAVEVTPDIAPLLVLGAVTGSRRGELVAIPRSAVGWKKNQITVSTAISSTGKVKSTKTRHGRTFTSTQRPSPCCNAIATSWTNGLTPLVFNWQLIHFSSALLPTALSRCRRTTSPSASAS